MIKMKPGWKWFRDCHKSMFSTARVLRTVSAIDDAAYASFVVFTPIRRGAVGYRTGFNAKTRRNHC